MPVEPFSGVGEGVLGTNWLSRFLEKKSNGGKLHLGEWKHLLSGCAVGFHRGQDKEAVGWILEFEPRELSVRLTEDWGPCGANYARESLQ